MDRKEDFFSMLNWKNQAFMIEQIQFLIGYTILWALYKIPSPQVPFCPKTACCLSELMTSESLICCISSPKRPIKHLKKNLPSPHPTLGRHSKIFSHMKPLHFMLIFSLESEFPDLKVPQCFIVAGQKIGRAANNIRSGFAQAFILCVFR